MKKTVFLTLAIITAMVAFAKLPLNPSGIEWDEVYRFDKCNVFKMEFYAKNNELMKTSDIKTYYQSTGDNFLVKMISGRKGYDMQTIIDKTNEVAIQIFGMGESVSPMYNAGGYKFPAPDDLKQLQVVPTDETRDIAGFSCKKFTYTYKKIFGEVWITDEVKLPNDIGMFRACKMAALHNTLSVEGFVMEMTTEDEKGGKTLMKTLALQTDEPCTIDLKGVEMSAAVNKVNYFTF